jgi:hypothetical protein
VLTWPPPSLVTVTSGSEHGEQAGEVAGAGGAQERGDCVPVLLRCDLRSRGARRDALAGAGGELPNCGGGAADGGGDFGERDTEQVVQDPGGAFGGGEGLEHDEQGVADGVVKGDAVGGVVSRGEGDRRSQDRLGQPWADVGGALHPGAAQGVQRAAGHRDHPPGLDVAGRVAAVGVHQAQPEVGDHDLGLRAAAEHGVGDSRQPRPGLLVGLGELGLPVVHARPACCRPSRLGPSGPVSHWSNVC